VARIEPGVEDAFMELMGPVDGETAGAAA